MENNSVQRGGRMLGSSKLYGMNRPQQSEWRFGDNRTFKDAHMQGPSRQHGDFRMQDSRLLPESRMEPNYPPQRMSDAAGMPGNARLPERVRGGSQPQREIRAHPESRMHPGNRLQGNTRTQEDLPVHDQLRSRSDAVAYDYNHRRPSKGSTGQPNFPMNSNENMRSGRVGYNQDGSVRQGFPDMLPEVSNEGSMEKNLDFRGPKNYGPLPGILPGSGHILTPSLTSSSGPQTVDDLRPTGNRGLYPKGKTSKAFDYLKTWRLKMNMPTDAFLLEKEDMMGNQQQGHNAFPTHTHDDWYTQPPTVEPRVGRAIIDPEWNHSGNSYAEKDAFGERSGNKFGDTRYGGHSESVAMYPRDQAVESGRPDNPPWKWDEEAPNSQSQSGKRNYESMASGQGFNSAFRENQYLPNEIMQAKRSRLSPSMQSDRETAEQYTSMMSEQANPSHNAMYSDDRYMINAGDTFHESQSEWKGSAFHRGPPPDPSKFARSFLDARGENVGSRHKSFGGEIKEMVTREGSKVPYSQSRDMRSSSHNPPHSQRSPQPIGRDDRYTEHPQDRAPRLSGRGRSPMHNQGSVDQGRPSTSEVVMSSAHYPLDMPPRSYPRSRSHRSPGLVKSPGPGMRDKSPLFPQEKSLTMSFGARDRSPSWRKGRSPGLGRERHYGLERERSPVRADKGPLRPPGKGRSPGPAGRGGLTGSSGKQGSPGAPRVLGPPRRARSPELTRRAKSPGPYGRMRSPGPRRSPGPQGRDRSPRKERSQEDPGRGRPLDHGRWKSPVRSLDYSGKGKSPGLYGAERSLGPSGRGKSPTHLEKGRLPASSREGRSPGPPRGPSSGPQERGRSPIKSHSGGRRSQGSIERGKLLPESSGRGSSPGVVRHRSSGTTGRGRSPGAAGRDRSLGLRDLGKRTGDSRRGRSPKLSDGSKPSKTYKSGSSGMMTDKSSEYQRQSRKRAPAGGFSAHSGSLKGQASSSSYPSRGRSPVKGKSLGGPRIRSEPFSRENTRNINNRSPRRVNRSSRSPGRKLPNENLVANDYGEYKDKIKRSPYLEEISSSPRGNRLWSPTRRTVLNVRSQHSRERSQSVDALQRGCSPVSPQSGGYQGGRNLYPQEVFIPERGEGMQQARSPQFYRDCPPLSLDDYARKNSIEIDMNDRSENQRDRFYSPKREVSVRARRNSADEIHNTKGKWREQDRGSQLYDGKASDVGKHSGTKNMSKMIGSEFPEISRGTLTEEEVDDEDLRIHLLRLREQKVEMKLMKLEEESKETELKLWELKKNRPTPRGESLVEEERRYPEKEIYPQGHKQDPWKYQHSPSESDRFHRQHKKY